MKVYKPKFNLRNKKTGKIHDLTDVVDVQWDEEIYEKVERKKNWSNQLENKVKSI